MCGENYRVGEYVHTVEGSSPRVRGKPSVRMDEMMPAWLSPACAGKTPLTELKHLLNEAHPRVCGENHVFHR